MSLADYLAKNYLTAEKPAKKSKKRKRKEISGLVIADDDRTGWESQTKSQDDDDRPTLAVGRTAEFRKKRTNNWTTVGTAAPPSTDQEAADAILNSAVQEQAAQRAREENDEAPVVEGVDEDEDEDAILMASGAHAGLQTAAQVTAAVEKKRRREKRASEAATAEGMGGETIYRDASGRIVNVAMKRAEARRKEQEEAAKKRREAEEAKGDVQRLEKERRRQELDDAKYMTFARGVDDVEMNEELKKREHWNDPAAGFVEKKKAGKSATGRPMYQGNAAPNRYGIRPGHRWDGVDRSNGFESEWFKARNRQENKRNLEYQWQMDE